MIRPVRVALVLSVAALVSGCALRSPSISELHHNPGRYQHDSVSIDGIVTTSWGGPFAPFRVYRVSDGTGEVMVVSSGGRTPTRGARVRVKGRVNELAVVGGRALGLHLREEKLDIRR
jgi:hypothetical protein